MKNYKLIKTNMCMITNQQDEMLVINRTKSDWPGLTFPGGHLEHDETLFDSVVREVNEETGLNIKRPRYLGKIIWTNDDKKICEIAYLFKTNEFVGDLISSSEGEAFFIKISDYKNYPLSTDFDKVLNILTKTEV